jgi:hypothetical protein
LFFCPNLLAQGGGAGFYALVLGLGTVSFRLVVLFVGVPILVAQEGEELSVFTVLAFVIHAGVLSTGGVVFTVIGFLGVGTTLVFPALFAHGGADVVSFVLTVKLDLAQGAVGWV